MDLSALPNQMVGEMKFCSVFFNWNYCKDLLCIFQTHKYRRWCFFIYYAKKPRVFLFTYVLMDVTYRKLIYDLVFNMIYILLDTLICWTHFILCPLLNCVALRGTYSIELNIYLFEYFLSEYRTLAIIIASLCFLLFLLLLLIFIMRKKRKDSK